jgi:hypothetical protein
MTMTTIAILPDTTGPAGGRFRAVAGKVQSVGRTPGEALDALNAQLDEAETGTLVVVQQLRPDRFFTAQQQQGLAELMDRWRAARDGGAPWSAEQQAELDALVEAELRAAAERAAALVRQRNP